MQQQQFNFKPHDKAINNIWPKICSFENLLAAYYKARKNKRSRQAVAQFELHREQELLQLQYELQTLTYQPGVYRQFQIYEGKKRTISAAPFRDRVVHHAIMNQLQPLLEPMLYQHCYACRKGYGVHRAVNQYEYWAKRYTYILKLDVQRYFPSIDQMVLLRQLKNQILDKSLLEILTRIIINYPSETPNKGMAIGNLTSQFFANWYLRDIDSFIAEQQGFNAYFRYVDDLFIFSDCKVSLWQLKLAIEQELIPLKLCFHQHKAVVCQTREKVPVLGYQVSRNKRWLQSSNGKKATKKITKQAQLCQQHKTTLEKVKPSMYACLGHAKHGQTQGLQDKLFSKLIF